MNKEGSRLTCSSDNASGALLSLKQFRIGGLLVLLLELQHSNSSPLGLDLIRLYTPIAKKHSQLQ